MFSHHAGQGPPAKRFARGLRKMDFNKEARKKKVGNVLVRNSDLHTA
jgi:hypothetical protein